MPINSINSIHRQPILHEISSSSEEVHSSGTVNIPLIDENRNLAPLVNVSFAENCSNELKEIAPYVFRAFSTIAKPGFNNIHVKPISENTEHDIGTTTTGTTEPHDRHRAISIEISDPLGPDLSHDQRLAQYALDLTHEAFLHGAYYFEMFERRAHGSNELYKSEQEMHKAIVYPANDKNPYLNVVRHVLQHLPDRNQLKVAFLKAYTDDVYSHMVNDLLEHDQEPVREWLGRLDDLAGRPRDVIWAALPSELQRANIAPLLTRALGSTYI